MLCVNRREHREDVSRLQGERECMRESERETHTIRESVREREADREGEGELIASVFQIKAQSI